VLGGIVGVMLGGFIGGALVDVPERDSRLPITSGIVSGVGVLFQLGAVVGGAVVGGVGGAIAGTLVGTRRSGTASADPSDEDELARLKKRVAEIERQRGDGQAETNDGP
jgi:hypothetical protein